MAKEVQRKQLGTIHIDTGTCWIGDPCYKNTHPHFGIEIPTGFGDSEYPVIAETVSTPGGDNVTCLFVEFVDDDSVEALRTQP